MLATTWKVWRIGKCSLRADKRIVTSCSTLLALLLLVTVISLSYGDFSMPITAVIKTLFGGGDATQQMVVVQLRLPRVLVALLVGLALGVSGAMLQGLTRNSLADPSIIGINQGAAVAAVALMVWFEGISLNWLPPAAFLGGAIAALLIYVLAWKGGSSPVRLVLVGIGIAAFAGSLTTTMVVFSDINRVSQFYMWLAGSVYGRSWDCVLMLALWLVWLLPLALIFAPQLDILMQGDDTAKALGMNVERTRVGLMMLSVALAAAAVSAAGVFGFLGLVAPHIARRLVGATYMGLLPTAALVGAVMLVTADLLGRSVIAPNQIPAGLVTAMLGAPYFFWQMRQHYRNPQ